MRIHAERAAIDQYQKQYGDVPLGSIIVTTLSPCNRDMSDRYGESCTDLIDHSNVKDVYCGYIDPTQRSLTKDQMFTVTETDNTELRLLCRTIADTFLKEDRTNFNDQRVKQAAGRDQANIWHRTFWGGLDEDQDQDLKPGQYYIWTVYFDDGTTKRIKVLDGDFNAAAYYARQKKKVIRVQYDWTVHG